MKKIYYIVSTLKRSGPTTQLYNLVNYLDRKRFEPYIITLSPEPEDSMWMDFHKIEVRLDTLALSRTMGFFVAKRKLKEKIERIHPDLVHTQGIRADVLFSSIEFKKPWFLTVRNYPWHDYCMKYGMIMGGIMVLKHMSVMKNCNNVITCSRAIGSLLEEKNIKNLPIQNGVNFQGEKPTKLKQINSLSKPVFVSVGHLRLRKNMIMLIDAFNLYSKKNDGSLVILGDGPQMERLKKRAGKGIYLFGRVSNVEDFLCSSDYFVSASKSEGLPNAVLEALATGLPALLSNIPSHLEIASECGQACDVFDIEDKKAVKNLAQKMCQAKKIFAAEETIANEASRAARDIFSAEKMSLKYQKAYSGEMQEKK